MLSTVKLRCAYGEAGGWPRGQPGRSCLQQADTSSAGPKCPSSRVLHGLGALAKPGAQRQTQEGVAGWPDFDPDFAEEPGLIEPYLSAIRVRGRMQRNAVLPIHPARHLLACRRMDPRLLIDGLILYLGLLVLLTFHEFGHA